MPTGIDRQKNVAAWPEQLLRLARRYSRLTCFLAGILPIALRLALLPVMPPPVPVIHDEFSYLLGADTFASGRLTNPAHPMWVHFETFHVNQQPTYGSKYPPAQSLFLAFGQKFLGNPWFGVVLSVGLMCSALCWMLQGWVEPLYAAITTLFVILTWGITGDWMNSYWGGAVAGIGGTLVIGSIPRLLREIDFVNVTLISTGIVILANSRPYEGLLTVISSSAVLLWRLHRERRSWAVLFKPRVIGAFALIILPAVAAMGYYNYRHTGSVLLLPYVVNERTYAAAPRFYLSAPTPEPTYRHETIRRLWEWDRELYQDARANPFAPIVFAAPFIGPFFFFNFLGLAALFGLVFGRRTVVLPALALLSIPVAGVLLEKAFVAHYLAPVCGAWVILAAAGLESIMRWQVRGHHAGPLIATLFLTLAFTTCISQATDFGNVLMHPQGIRTRPLLIDQLQKQGGRHLILVSYKTFHYSRLSVKFFNVTVNRVVANQSEWVYNRADIDCSAIVWAHDMGTAKNQELLDYYRDRKVWLLEPDVNPLKLTPIDRSQPRKSS